MSVFSVRTQPATQSWQQAWSEALDTLEYDLERAEAVLAAGRSGSARIPEVHGTTWVAPQLPGPMPGNLRARAEAILTRQLRVSEELARGLAASRREVQLTQLMESHVADHTVPAFLDACL